MIPGVPNNDHMAILTAPAGSNTFARLPFASTLATPDQPSTGHPYCQESG